MSEIEDPGDPELKRIAALEAAMDRIAAAESYDDWRREDVVAVVAEAIAVRPYLTAFRADAYRYSAHEPEWVWRLRSALAELGPIEGDAS